MAFGRTRDNRGDNGTDGTGQPLESYDFSYRGGLPQLPKAKVGKIKFEIYADHFCLKPTTGSKKFWEQLEIPYSTILSLEVTDRTVSTFEGIAGGLNSRQLNQKNNVHVKYEDVDGETLLRLEMLSGVTVMGQAKKCLEFEDRLRTFRVREQFASGESETSGAPAAGIAEEIAKLGSLKDQGLISEEEFVAAKARLIEG